VDYSLSEFIQERAIIAVRLAVAVQAQYLAPVAHHIDPVPVHYGS